MDPEDGLDGEGLLQLSVDLLLKLLGGLAELTGLQGRLLMW